MPGQLLRETNPAQGFAPALVPQHEDVNGDYKATGEKNPLPVSVEDSGAAAQVDIQYRKQKMVPTHAGVLITNGATNSQSTWQDSDGFNEIACTMFNDAAVNSVVYIYWSNDGVNTHGVETMIGTGTSQQRAGMLPTKARWYKIAVANTDSAPHTMSAWVYLKV